ncbi:MAG: carboxylating nicotinate-nucleotide diphosphorylase [Dehalococcoidia bacterium]|nr:MAG: carboxylating nicotinate-nucleotide diphosphorylase [Dehalococcoidia bacterium]
MNQYFKWNQVEQITDCALAEDQVTSDVTTEALIPSDLEGRASILVKGDGVLAGVEVAKAVFLHVDPSLRVEVRIQDGAKVRKGDVVAIIQGRVASILKAERVALNFLTRLSGIASETARYVEATKGLKARITDTRKTTPGIRLLEKYAVRVGGGRSHRQHLGDGILIKDNHLAALRSLGLGLKEAIERARQSSTLKIEVEVESIDGARQALEAGADIIMLDNMAIEDMRQVVEIARGGALIEASGGITLDNVRSVAESGVDLISVGAITHSAKALDLSLELEPR